jgi:hypothetical protein
VLDDRRKSGGFPDEVKINELPEFGGVSAESHAPISFSPLFDEDERTFLSALPWARSGYDAFFKYRMH